jgi:hypothetical protein
MAWLRCSEGVSRRAPCVTRKHKVRYDPVSYCHTHGFDGELFDDKYTACDDLASKRTELNTRGCLGVCNCYGIASTALNAAQTWLAKVQQKTREHWQLKYSKLCPPLHRNPAMHARVFGWRC